MFTSLSPVFAKLLSLSLGWPWVWPKPELQLEIIHLVVVLLTTITGTKLSFWRAVCWLVSNYKHVGRHPRWSHRPNMVMTIFVQWHQLAGLLPTGQGGNCHLHRESGGRGLSAWFNMFAWAGILCKTFFFFVNKQQREWALSPEHWDMVLCQWGSPCKIQLP